MEIERKFWIKESNLIFEYRKLSMIEQTYINRPDDFYEIRLRKYHGEERYYLDFKSKGNLKREEFGIKMNEEQYLEIKNGASEKRTLTKKRYYLGYKGVFFDEYQDELKGYNTLEVEGTEEYVDKFKLPHPFNDGIEVTYDKKFKNRNIAGYHWEDIKNWGVSGVPGKKGTKDGKT